MILTLESKLNSFRYKNTKISEIVNFDFEHLMQIEQSGFCQFDPELKKLIKQLEEKRKILNKLNLS